MKTIAIDLSPAEITPAGIGQYTVNLTRNLIAVDKKNHYLIYTTKPFDKINYEEDRVENVVIPFPSSFRARGIRWMLEVNKDLQKKKADLLISYSNHFFSLIFPNTIQFIHDLAPIKYPQFFPVKARLMHPFTTRIALQKSKYVATISNTVKKELLAFSKVPSEKVMVLFPAMNEMAKVSNPEKEIKVPDLPEKYILTVATLEPRKNINSGLKAFAKLKQDHQLPSDVKYVLVGKQGWYYKNIYKLVKALGLEKDVIFTGFLSDEVMPEVYKNCSVFLFLSYYEGFGMPPLEALAYNKPTLLSNIPVLQECFGPWAKFAEPENIIDIADKLLALYNGKKPKVSDAVMEKFSWVESARKLSAIINQDKPKKAK